MGVTMTTDGHDKEARELLAMLGLTDAQINAAFNGTLQLKEKITQPVRKKKIYKEYILSRTAVCRTCGTKVNFYYYMNQMDEYSGLISQPISVTEFKQTMLPVRIDKYMPWTCNHCKEHLQKIDKDTLIDWLLKAINEKERYRNGR